MFLVRELISHMTYGIKTVLPSCVMLWFHRCQWCEVSVIIRMTFLQHYTYGSFTENDSVLVMSLADLVSF